ncbi:MAG: hypothetical protein ACI87W_002105 [Halieaceae bacterium]|jgi:hypothetical protein
MIQLFWAPAKQGKQYLPGNYGFYGRALTALPKFPWKYSDSPNPLQLIGIKQGTYTRVGHGASGWRLN